KPDERYQTARSIIDDLEAWQAGAAHNTIIPTATRIRYIPSYKKWIAVGAAVVVLGGGVYLFQRNFTLRPSGAAVAVKPVSLALLPFHNASSDASLDWIGTSLANILSTDVGQSARLRTVSSDRLFQILKDLRVPPTAEIDPDTMRRLAEFSNSDILVSGRYAK